MMKIIAFFFCIAIPVFAFIGCCTSAKKQETYASGLVSIQCIEYTMKLEKFNAYQPKQD
jgi:hypothetical protein